MDRFCYLRFMLVCVVLSCLFLAALWSPAGKGLTSWLFYVLCFPVFCRFPKYVLVHIKIKGEMQHKVVFHQGLHYLLRYEQSLGTEIHHFIEILTGTKTQNE